MATIIRAPHGTARREVPIDEVEIPDLWGIAMWLDKNGQDTGCKDVLECWHLCHDLLKNLRGDTDAR